MTDAVENLAVGVVTVNADLSSHILSADGLTECRLPSHNPDTQAPFSSEDEVRAYAASIIGREHFFQSVEHAPPKRMIVSPVEFKLMFTGAERLAIRKARNPAAGSAEAAINAGYVIDDFFAILDDSRLSTVNLADANTIEGVQFLVSVGVLTAERAAALLAGV